MKEYEGDNGYHPILPSLEEWRFVNGLNKESKLYKKIHRTLKDFYRGDDDIANKPEDACNLVDAYNELNQQKIKAFLDKYVGYVEDICRRHIEYFEEDETCDWHQWGKLFARALTQLRRYNVDEETYKYIYEYYSIFRENERRQNRSRLELVEQ